MLYVPGSILKKSLDILSTPGMVHLGIVVSQPWPTV